MHSSYLARFHSTDVIMNSTPLLLCDSMLLDSAGWKGKLINERVELVGELIDRSIQREQQTGQSNKLLLLHLTHLSIQWSTLTDELIGQRYCPPHAVSQLRKLLPHGGACIQHASTSQLAIHQAAQPWGQVAGRWKVWSFDRHFPEVSRILGRNCVNYDNPALTKES